MTVAVRESLAATSRCLDDLRSTLSGLDDRGITQALREVEALSRRTQSVMLDMVAELESRGFATREGFATTARLLAAVLRLSAGEARARVEHATMVSHYRRGTAALDRDHQLGRSAHRDDREIADEG